jgi:hypothetical protein
MSEERRYFRATFQDAAYPDMQITVEFEARYPMDERIDYSKLALHTFQEKVATGHIKIRDIEPLES